MVAKTTLKQAFERKSADDRRRELIAAGIACLGKGGMAAFTIDKICKQAGISRGLINHHFNTKDELLSSIYAEMTDHLVQDHGGLQDGELLAQIIATSFDEASFNRSNMRAWLAIWGQVPSNPVLSKMHRQRYDHYKERIKSALRKSSAGAAADHAIDSVARQLIAIIDGLWLEYCLHSNSFSLAEARADCYRFLAAYGIEVDPPSSPQPE
jgi:AcrR family transcriptional regulator